MVDDDVVAHNFGHVRRQSNLLEDGLVVKRKDGQLKELLLERRKLIPRLRHGALELVLAHRLELRERRELLAFGQKKLELMQPRGLQELDHLHLGQRLRFGLLRDDGHRLRGSLHLGDEHGTHLLELVHDQFVDAGVRECFEDPRGGVRRALHQLIAAREAGDGREGARDHSRVINLREHILQLHPRRRSVKLAELRSHPPEFVERSLRVRKDAHVRDDRAKLGREGLHRELSVLAERVGVRVGGERNDVGHAAVREHLHGALDVLLEPLQAGAFLDDFLRNLRAEKAREPSRDALDDKLFHARPELNQRDFVHLARDLDAALRELVKEGFFEHLLRSHVQLVKAKLVNPRRDGLPEKVERHAREHPRLDEEVLRDMPVGEHVVVRQNHTSGSHAVCDDGVERRDPAPQAFVHQGLRHRSNLEGGVPVNRLLRKVVVHAAHERVEKESHV
mmetsp:Transcript_12766/g.42122  ORF Transcript_12766/g.42122 Transcript_12766/m.42122 type:complete len:450 (+) Transcript_12766:1361-2710(+)